MSSVTITISVQPGADVSASQGVEAGPSPLALEELRAEAVDSDTASQRPEELDVLSADSAEEAPEPMALEELDVFSTDDAEEAPEPMPLEELESGAAAAAPKRKTTKK